MVPLIAATIITCSDAAGIINKIVSSIGLTNQQKIEVISELRKLIPTCPVTVKKDESIKK